MFNLKKICIVSAKFLKYNQHTYFQYLLGYSYNYSWYISDLIGGKYVIN